MKTSSAIKHHRAAAMVHGRVQGDRVMLSGEAVTVLEGRLTLSGAGR